MVIRLISVDRGKTENWLSFKCYNGQLDLNREFYIDYCGSEIHHNMSLPEDIEDRLKESLNDDFGYSPFDMDKVRKTLEKHRDYVYR